MMSDVEVIASSGNLNANGTRAQGQVVGIEQIRITGRRSPDPLNLNNSTTNVVASLPIESPSLVAEEIHRPQTPHTPMEQSTVLKAVVSKLQVGIPPPISSDQSNINVALQPCENPEDILAGMTISKMKTSHPSFYYQHNSSSSPHNRVLTVKPVDLKNSPDIHVVSSMRPLSPSMTLKSFGRPLSPNVNQAMYKLDPINSVPSLETGTGTGNIVGRSLESTGSNRKIEAAIVGETVGKVDYFSDSLQFDEEKTKTNNAANNATMNPAAIDRLAKSSTLIQQIQQQQQLKAEIYASKTPTSGALSPKNIGQPVYLPVADSPRMMSGNGNNTLTNLTVTGSSNNLLNTTASSNNLTSGIAGNGIGGNSGGVVMVTSMNRIADQPDSHYFINSKEIANTNKLQLMKTMNQLRHYKTGTSPEKKVQLFQQQILSTSSSLPEVVMGMKPKNHISSIGGKGDHDGDGCHPSCTCGTNGRPLSPLQHHQHQSTCPAHGYGLRQNRQPHQHDGAESVHNEPRVIAKPAPAVSRPQSSSGTRPRPLSPSNAGRRKEDALDRMRKFHPDSPAAIAAEIEQQKKTAIPGGAMSKYPIDHKDLVVKQTSKPIAHVITVGQQQTTANSGLETNSIALSMNSSHRLGSTGGTTAGGTASPLYTPATFRRPKTRDAEHGREHSPDSTLFPDLESKQQSPTKERATKGGRTMTDDDNNSLQDSAYISVTDSYKNDQKEIFLQASLARSIDEEDMNHRIQQRSYHSATSASSNTQKTTVPAKIKKKYYPHGEDLQRKPSPTRSRTQSPARHSDNDPDHKRGHHTNNGDDDDDENCDLTEKSIPQLMQQPGPGHPNNIRCTSCMDKEAILWCTRCVKAFCAICWNRINHHALYNMVNTTYQDKMNDKEKKRLEKKKLQFQQSNNSSLRPFNEDTTPLLDRHGSSSHLHHSQSHMQSHATPAGKSYSHAIHFTSYIGDDELHGGHGRGQGDGQSRGHKGQHNKLDRNLIPAPIPHIDNPVLHYVDYPNPPVFIDGKGHIREHSPEKFRFSGARNPTGDEPNYHDRFTGKLIPAAPLVRPFSSPAGGGEGRYAMASSSGSGKNSPTARTARGRSGGDDGATNALRRSNSRSPSPTQNRPVSSGGRLQQQQSNVDKHNHDVKKEEKEKNEEKRLMNRSKSLSKDQTLEQGGADGTVDLEMSDSIASSFHGEVGPSFHYVTKQKMLEMMTGRRLPLKMSNIAPDKQIHLKPSLPYQGEMKKKKKSKPCFAISAGGTTIAKYGAPPKNVEQLTGISYNLNNTIDWKKGVFQSGAYHGTEHPNRPHTSHGSTNNDSKSEIKPIKIKIYNGVPVYVVKKSKEETNK